MRRGGCGLPSADGPREEAEGGAGKRGPECIVAGVVPGGAVATALQPQCNCLPAATAMQLLACRLCPAAMRLCQLMRRHWPAYDNEAEDMQRFDFTLAELNANSEWFQEAWRILRTLEGGFLGVSALPHTRAAPALPQTRAALRQRPAPCKPIRAPYSSPCRRP